ncbi:MAG: hypothetical protein WC758_03015 [Candidatus Woesearchaeota archaeon]|jgi:hypothetical protein
MENYDKFKTYTILLSVVVIILVLFLIFGKTKTTYICYDGVKQSDSNKCMSVPPLTITQKQADAAVTTYANAYAMSRGDRASIVNIYRSNLSWHSDVLFSNAKTKEVHTVILNIDGKTSSITCLEGCDYLITINNNTTITNTTTN